MIEPVTWDVVHVAKISDGDTVKLVRSRAVNLDGRAYRLTDINDTAVRLVHVNTPERGKPGWAQARDDLRHWIDITERQARATVLRVHCYESAGWDRILGDLVDADGQSASQWLMRERGWPAYEETR